MRRISFFFLAVSAISFGWPNGHAEFKKGYGQWIKANFVGQPRAVKAIQEEINLLLDSLEQKKTSRRVLVFAGPGGVGKTFLPYGIKQTLKTVSIRLKFETLEGPLLHHKNFDAWFEAALKAKENAARVYLIEGFNSLSGNSLEKLLTFIKTGKAQGKLREKGFEKVTNALFILEYTLETPSSRLFGHSADAHGDLIAHLFRAENDGDRLGINFEIKDVASLIELVPPSRFIEFDHFSWNEMKAVADIHFFQNIKEQYLADGIEIIFTKQARTRILRGTDEELWELGARLVLARRDVIESLLEDTISGLPDGYKGTIEVGVKEASPADDLNYIAVPIK